MVYDLFLFFVGIPLTFWMLFRIDDFIQSILESRDLILSAAIYFQTYLTLLILFRVSFHYARWAWPLNVIRGIHDPSVIHRIILGGISIALIVDFARTIFKLSLGI